jgi:hypothetical protein
MCASTSGSRASRFARDSANVRPSGATSWSWKVKNGAPSFSMNSNAAASFVRAAAIGSPPAASHGRSKVPTPNTSEPGQLNECHRQIATRR